MKNAPVIGLMVSIIAGCASFGQLERGLAALVGRTESEVFSVLGYPSGKQEFGEDTVYVWSNNQNTTMFLPQTKTTTGYLGATPVYTTTSTTQAVPMSFNCTIKIVVSSGLVKTWEYGGNLGGCEPYINRLNLYLSNAKSSTVSVATPSNPESSVPVYTDAQRLVAAGKTVELSMEPFGLYKEPSRESMRLQRLYKKDSLVVEEVAGEWIKVRTSDGTQGWVMRIGVGNTR